MATIHLGPQIKEPHKAEESKPAGFAFIRRQLTEILPCYLRTWMRKRDVFDWPEKVRTTYEVQLHSLLRI